MSNRAEHQSMPVAVSGSRTRARLQSVRRSMDLDGLRLSVLDWIGPEHPVGPPVVLLHGALQSSEGMGNLASHLARRSRVVVPDLRGRGESGKPADGYEPETMAADVAAMIEQMRLDRPVIIGRLHGGLVGWHLAANHPKLLSGLVIGDTAPEVTDGHAERLIAATRAMPRSFASLEDAYTYYQRSLGLPLERALHDIPYDLRRSRDGFTWQHNLDLIARIEGAALPRSDWDVLAKVHVPTLVLRGQRGSLSPEMARRMCEVIGDCTVQTVLSSGRDVFLGGGAEQAFAAIDLFMLRLTDLGPGSVLARGTALRPRDLIEPVVRSLNGRDAAALKTLLRDGAEVEIIQHGRPVRTGGADLVDSMMTTLLERHPGAVFAVERFLASRTEASVQMVARSHPAGDSDVDKDLAFYLDLWFEYDGHAITYARLHLSETG